MRVEPEHRERLALLGTEPRHGRERADREAVIAAHEDRELSRAQARVDGVAHVAAPDLDLGEMSIAVGARRLRIDWARDVTAVADLAPEPPQGLVEAGNAQRLGPHRRAASPGADVGRRADQRYGGLPRRQPKSRA